MMETAVSNATESMVTAQSRASTQINVTDLSGVSSIDLFQKIQLLRNVLDADLTVCDIKWTLFVSAALNSIYGSDFNMFPDNAASSQDDVDIHALLEIIRNAPKLDVVLQRIDHSKYDLLDEKIVELLYSVLVLNKGYKLRLCDPREVRALPCFAANRKNLLPMATFEVTRLVPWTPSSYVSNKKIGFHLGKLHTVHSILTTGFKAKQPVTLVLDVNKSLEISPHNVLAVSNVLGKKVACLSLCEYINDPEYVQRKETSPSSIQHNTHKYAEITDPNLVNIRYLLFYNVADNGRVLDRLVRFLSNYKNALRMTALVVVVASVGLSTRNNGQYLWEIVSDKFQTLMDYASEMFESD